MFSATSRYKIWFAVSGILVLASLSLLLIWGLVPGIDFKGGVLLELEFEKNVSPQEARTEIAAAGFGEPIVQPVGEKRLLIKTKPLAEGETTRLKDLLEQEFGNYQEIRFESIGPAIGRELARRAYWQIVLVILGILLYIAYAFRKIGKASKHSRVSAWRLGIATVIALMHDIIIPMGVFAVLGKFRGVEVDSLFITALLTILGFSVHDTIVVFDRVRENMQKYPYKSLASIIDFSVNSTLARSINTSSTLILVLVAMLLFGGATVFYFVLALLIGVMVGTYSSIFIASPILTFWQKKD